LGVDQRRGVNSQPPTPKPQTLEAGAEQPLGIGNWELGVDQRRGANSQLPTPNSQTLEAAAEHPLGVGRWELGVDQPWLPALAPRPGSGQAGRGADDLPVARGLQPSRGRGAAATSRAPESRYRVVTGTRESVTRRRAGPVDPPAQPIAPEYARDAAAGWSDVTATGVSDPSGGSHVLGVSDRTVLGGAERTRPTNPTPALNARESAPPFAPPAERGEPHERARSFQDFADEFSERLQAAASELGLLQER
jgi:hypothetical protein